MSLFIPSRIRVGYQERKDTVTGRLAYVIYYDATGKIRKEVSWDGWRREKLKQGQEPIPADELDNVPFDGVVINKDVQRCNWSHFSSGRSMIRIYDPRGIEFEITPANLIAILMETDCNHRALDGKFVYAWAGGDIVLLPCGSETYQAATKNTELLTSKFSAKALVEGRSYTTKKGIEQVYMGRMPWTTWAGPYDYYRWQADKKKLVETKRLHVFWCPDAKEFVGLPGATHIAHENSPECVPDYATLVDWLDQTPAKVGERPIELRPRGELHLKTSNSSPFGWRSEVTTLFKVVGDKLYHIQATFTDIKNVKEALQHYRAYRASYHRTTATLMKAKVMAVDGTLDEYKGVFDFGVVHYSPLDSVQCHRVEQEESQALLAEIGFAEGFFLPLDPEKAKEAKQQFFGELHKPCVSMPNGEIRKLDILNMPETNQPWLPKPEKAVTEEAPETAEVP